MKHARDFVLLPLLAVCAGCAASDPPIQAPRAVAPQQRVAMLTRLGDDMRQDGDAAGAVGLYRAASQASPRDPVLLDHMGAAFMQMNDPARAEQAFRGELMIDPDNVGARRGLALALLAQGNAAAALPILQQLAQGSNDPGLLRAEGTALDMVGRPADAQTVYRRGLQLAPIDADLHGNLALSLALSGDQTSALAEMQAAIASPDPDPRQNANAVLVLALTGNTAAAQARGETTIGPAATDVLLARARQALEAADARSRAMAVGLVTNNAIGGTPPLQSAATSTAITAPAWPAAGIGPSSGFDPGACCAA